MRNNIRFLDLLIQKQTQKQTNVFSYALLGITQLEISNIFSQKGVTTQSASQQAFSNILENCYWNDIQEFMLKLEK